MAVPTTVPEIGVGRAVTKPPHKAFSKAAAMPSPLRCRWTRNTRIKQTANDSVQASGRVKTRISPPKKR
ncbi:MAG: hypothetical protein PHQ27_10060 [Victivallales bacterium]|nr:hypothetical protein [Victivallales bacterium]